ncbi:MAG: class I adenylate cyclase [Smithellaceae bacterium]
MLSSTLLHNKKRYLDYNRFRQKTLLTNSPKDGPVILYMLPWLLSVNRPSVPGYVKDLKEPFHVFKIEENREILQQEVIFKNIFGIKEEKSLVRHYSQSPQIQGIYTIGSAGTVSQTSHSDCDIWICFDKNDFTGKALHQLNEKLNLIKDWLDARLKIPVYFFLSDVNDIRQCNFGSLDFESSGSAQKNVLKEEFYRTTILIAGKIPFWWVCFDPDQPVDYDETFAQITGGDLGDRDFIDMADLKEVKQDEYFGASLWQFNKSLTHPLKSIIKMLQLKMFLESPEEDLLCHKLRRAVLGGQDKAVFPDPSIFGMNAVLDYYAQNAKEEYFEFIKKCFYLRFEIKLLSKSQTLKEEAAAEVFKKYKIDRRDVYRLNEFDSWQLQEKAAFGELMFGFLIDVYKDIVRIQKGKSGEIAPQDLTIIGRKLSSTLQTKENKVAVLHIPSETVNLPVFTFATNGKTWQVNSSDNQSAPLIAHQNIISCIAYIVWNGIYNPVQTRMAPNQTAVTIQEIINLGKMIKDVFGSFDISGVHFGNFLQKETITKMLLVVSFESQKLNMDVHDFCVIYKNNWEELFVRRFPSLEKMKAFWVGLSRTSPNVQVQYYVQRSNKYYEKIIERVKYLVTQMLATP